MTVNRGGPEDLEDLREATCRALGLPATPSDDAKAAAAYRVALKLAWEHMKLVLGPLGAQAIVNHSLRLAARRCPGVSLASADGDGLDLSRLERGPGEGELSEACRSLEELCAVVFQVLRELTGEVLVVPLLEEMRQRQASNTET